MYPISLNLLQTLTILPDVFLLLSIFHQDTLTMLLPSLPLALVDLPAWPIEAAISVLLVVLVVALVSFAVRPSEDTIAIHRVLLPFTLVLTTVSPLICTYLSGKSQKRSK